MTSLSTLLLAAVLAGWAVHSDEGKWQEIRDPGEKRISVSIDAAQPLASERLLTDVSAAETGWWRLGSQRIFLHYSYTLADTIFVVDQGDNLESLLALWYDKGMLALGDYSSFGERSRFYEYQHFQHDGTACLIFQHTWGGARGTERITSSTGDIAPVDARALGHDRLIGTFCDPGRQRYSKDDLLRFLTTFELRTPAGTYQVSS